MTRFVPSSQNLVRGAGVFALLLISAQPARGQAVGVLDDFNRADAPFLGTASTGQTWAIHAGSPGVSAATFSPGSGFTLASIDAGVADVNLHTVVVQPDQEFWVVLRFADGANYWRFGRWGGAAYSLQQIANNSLGAPAIQTGATITPSAGDSVTCKVRTSLIECDVNGTLVARTTSSAGAGATRVGLSTYESAGARLDDFSAFVPAVPDLSTRIDGPAAVDFGTEGVWSTTVTNIGGEGVPSAEVVLTPPTSVTNLTISGASCVTEGAGRRCVLGQLLPGAAGTLEVRATAPSTPAQLQFLAVATSPLPEENTANNSASFSSIARQPPPPGARVFDQFDRPDGPVGAAESGQPWTNHANPLSIVGGAAAPSSGFVLSSVDSGDGGGELTATLVAPSAEFWIVGRLSDGANYYRFGRWNGEPYHLQKIQGNYATILPRLATVSPAPGDQLRCQFWLDEIECGVNGVVVVRTYDSFNETAPSVGLSSWQAPDTRFDELVLATPPARTDISVSIEGPLMLRSGDQGSWSARVRNRGTVATPQTSVLIAPPAQLSGVSVGGGACTPEGSQFRCTIGALEAGATSAFAVGGIAPLTPTTMTLNASTPVLSGESRSSDNSSVHVTQVRAQIPAGALVVDLFDRPDAATPGTADTGQVWTTHSPGMWIQGKEAAIPGGSLATLNTGVSSSDISVMLSVPGSEFWLVFRFSDSANYWRFGRWQSGPYQLQQVKDSALGAPPLQVLGTVQPAPGDQIACRVNIFGIECAVNDVPVVRTADMFNRTATRVGFSAYQDNTTRFDDLVVVSVPAGPDLSVTVQAPAVTLAGTPQTIWSRVRNNGGSAASATTLVTVLPATSQTIQVPSGCTLVSGQTVNCQVPDNFLPGASQEFAIGFTINSASTVSGSAQAVLAGDGFPSDNSTSWSTGVETAGSGIFDGFDRPDTTSGLGSTLTGQAWQVRSGAFRITERQARATEPGSLITVDGGFAFGSLEVVLGADAASAGLAFRVVDAANYYRLTSEGGIYKVTKVVNGIVQDLQFYIHRFTTSAQPGDVVRVVSRPDDGVFVMVNGRHILDAGDQQFMNATGWGLLSTSGTASFTSFSLRRVIEGLTTHDGFGGPQAQPLGTPTSGVNYHWLMWMGGGFLYDQGTAHPAHNDWYTLGTLDTSSERASTKVTLVEPGSGAWIVFRYVEHGTYFRFGHQNGNYTVTYAEGDGVISFPVPLEQFASIAPSPGDVLEVKQSADGTVECFVNGVRTHRFVESGGPGFRSTLTGLAAISRNSVFDDFIVTPLPR